MNRWLSCAVAGAACCFAVRADALIGAGKTAPDWSGTTIQKQKLTSAALKGKAVLVNFFSFG